MTAQTIETNIKGLSITKNDEGLWLNFKSESDNKQASINITDMAERNVGSIVGSAIMGWCNGVIKSMRDLDYCYKCGHQLDLTETIRIRENPRQHGATFKYHMACIPDEPIKSIEVTV